MLIIDDSNYRQFQRLDGYGLVPRDYTQHPQGCYHAAYGDVPAEIPLIPRSEWSARIKEMEQTKTRLSDLRRTANGGKPIPSLYQGQWGYCWAHGPTHAVMILRAIANLPYVPLSAFSVAGPIMQGRNEGAWAALALDRIVTHGICSQATWPQGQANPARWNATAAAEAAHNRVSESWQEVGSPWDRDLTFEQVMSLLLSRIPVCGDFMWWRHSVCLLDPVEVEPGSFGVRIWNSWSDSWGDLGEAVLRGSQARPDGAVAPRAMKEAA